MCWIRSRRSLGETPGFAATSIESHLPAPFNATWAVCGSKATSVAPPRLSAEPKPKIPTMVACIGGPSTSTVKRSPRRRPWADAVRASTPISPPRCGRRPWRTVTADSSGSAIELTPSVGAPPVVIAFPFLSTSWAYPTSEPAAIRTPGTCSICVRTAFDTRSAGPASMPPRPFPLKCWMPLTSTATPLSIWPNRLSNARFIVSVRM